MKHPLMACLLMICGLSLAGCGGKSSDDGDSSGGVLTAPVDYLGAVVKGKQNAEKTVGKVDVTALNQAISMFNVENGRNPNSLQELVPKYVPRLPEAPLGSEFSYDPSSGTVKLVPKAPPPQK